jgi:hypothetical protein
MSLAVPAGLGMLSQTVMWVVDTIFLGHLGTTEQGAAGLAGPYLRSRTPRRCGMVTQQGLYASLLSASCSSAAVW